MNGTSGVGDWITVREAASRFGITERAVLKRIQAGRLDAEWDERRWYVRWPPSGAVPPTEPNQPGSGRAANTAKSTRAASGKAVRAGEPALEVQRLIRDLQAQNLALAGELGYLKRLLQEKEEKLNRLREAQQRRARSGRPRLSFWGIVRHFRVDSGAAE